MQIGLGQLRFSPSVFYDMTFEEFLWAAQGMNLQERSQATTRVGACSVVGGAGISTTRQERTEGQASRYMYLPMGEEAQEQRQQQAAQERIEQVERWQNLKT